MRRLLALLFAITLWFNCATTASAAEVSGLVPCRESPAFQQRAANPRDTVGDPSSGEKRLERYANKLCGPDGLPRLITDGRLSHADEFLIPGLLFLFITGWIGWVGRAYLIAVRDTKNPEMKEVIIDLPLALKCMLTGFTWPLAALKELLSGELTVAEEEIPVSPR